MLHQQSTPLPTAIALCSINAWATCFTRSCLSENYRILSCRISLAEAIAEALVVPLLVVRCESVVGTYLGETAVRLKKLFEYASTRNCVLFFDEFEILGKERGNLHETGEIKRVVSALLMQIDNLPSYVMVIGATNHAELLDRAVWRHFQVRMTLPGLTRARLVEWFEKFEQVTSAVVMVIAWGSPGVSTARCRLMPDTFLPAS